MSNRGWPSGQKSERSRSEHVIEWRKFVQEEFVVKPDRRGLDFGGKLSETCAEFFLYVFSRAS